MFYCLIFPSPRVFSTVGAKNCLLNVQVMLSEEDQLYAKKKGNCLNRRPVTQQICIECLLCDQALLSMNQQNRGLAPKDLTFQWGLGGETVMIISKCTNK